MKERSIPCEYCKNKLLCKYRKEYEDCVDDFNDTIYDYRLENVIVCDITCLEFKEDLGYEE